MPPKSVLWPEIGINFFFGIETKIWGIYRYVCATSLRGKKLLCLAFAAQVILPLFFDSPNWKRTDVQTTKKTNKQPPKKPLLFAIYSSQHNGRKYTCTIPLLFCLLAGPQLYRECTFVPSNDAPRPMTKGTHDRVGSLGKTKQKTEQINFYSVIKK